MTRNHTLGRNHGSWQGMKAFPFNVGYWRHRCYLRERQQTERDAVLLVWSFLPSLPMVKVVPPTDCISTSAIPSWDGFGFKMSALLMLRTNVELKSDEICTMEIDKMSTWARHFDFYTRTLQPAVGSQRSSPKSASESLS